MAGEGVPYQAQSENFPSVAVPHSDLGAPYIIKPEDWYRMFEAEGGVTGSILPQLTAITNAGTSLVDNAYDQQIAHQKALADNAEIMARTKLYGAQTDNISNEASLNHQLKEQQVIAETQKNQIGQHAVNDSRWLQGQDQKAIDDYDNWMGELTKVDSLDPNYDSKIAEINARHPDASQNPLTMNRAQVILQRNKTIRDNNDLVQQRNDELKTLTDPNVAQYLPKGFNPRATVNRGEGQAAIDQANRQMLTERIQAIMPFASRGGYDPTTGRVRPNDYAYLQDQLTRINGKVGALPGDPGATPDPTVITARGTLNPETEALVSQMERQYNKPTPQPIATVTTKTTGKGPGGEVETTTTTTRPETEEEKKPTPAGATAGGVTDADVNKAIGATAAWKTIRDGINNNTLKPPTGVSPTDPTWIRQQWYNEMVNSGEAIPDAVQKRMEAERTQGANAPAPTYMPNVGPGPTPSAVPGPAQTPGKKIRIPTGARRRVGEVEEGGGSALAYEPATTAPVEGENLAIPVRLASETQTQGAPQAYTIPGDARTVDWSNLRFGQATTFGLNYDGSIDRKDDGQGAFGHNTRDPRLVGASINVRDLNDTFGAGTVTRQADGTWKITNPRFAQLARNGDIQVQIVSPDGKMVQMPMVDIGPGATHNKIDLTYAASRLFRTQGKAMLGYQFVDRYGRPLTATSGV